MILTGFSSDEIQDIISKNTFVNLRVKMEFINWKRYNYECKIDFVHIGADGKNLLEQVAFAARVSNPANQK
jgi:hypothetical protein